LTVYLVQQKKPYVITLVPAMFMSAVCTSFLLVYDNAFNLPPLVGYFTAIFVFVLSGLFFFIWRSRQNEARL